MFVSFFDADVVISILDIKFREDFGTAEVCEEVGD
jgi:hypothetical protein